MMPLTLEQSRMVEDNIGLAYHAAKKMFPKNHIEYDEIISICLLTLSEAAMNFDPSKGFKFSTYAIKCMEWSVFKEIHPKKPRVESAYLEDCFTENNDGQSQWERFLTGDSPENEIVCEIAKEQVKDCICENLSNKYKDIFLIHRQNPELTQKEVADLVGCSQTNVSRTYKLVRDKYLNTI